MSLRRVLLSLVALCLAAACVPPPEDIDEVVQFDPEGVLGQIQEAERMVVGIQPNSAPFSFWDPATGEADGFVVDLAEEVATALGVEAEYVEFETADDLISAVDQGDIDLGFPLVPIAERLVAPPKESEDLPIPFSDPYYVAHQRLLAPQPELSGRVCGLLEPRLGVERLSDGQRVFLRVELVYAGDPQQCARMLRSGAADGATAADPLLMIMWSHAARCSTTCSGAALDRYTIFGDQLTTEPYGIAARRGPGGLASFVNTVIGEAIDEGRWTEYYDRWLRPYLREEQSPPEMTLEEAAALYPLRS